MGIATERAVADLKAQLHALTEVSKTLTLPLELPELLNLVLSKITGVIPPAEVGAVMLWDESSGLFRPVAACGFDFQYFKQIGLRAGESITGKAYDFEKAYLLTTREEIAAARANLRPANRAVLARSLGNDALPITLFAGPLMAGKQKYGVLTLQTLKGPSRFNEQDLPFLQSIADLIALAIDRVRLEARADVARQSRESERLRAELMAILSHELRLPLTTIKGYTSALLMENMSWTEEKGREFLRCADEECDNMEIMIRDILDSSIIDVNQLNLEMEPVRLQYIAREVATEIQRRLDTHRLIVDVPSDFPIVDADPRWIKQVFRNILDNAIKYSPDGGLIVIRGETRANDVVISISDQGIGISPEDLIPLFEKFFRVRSALQYHVAGTGLGLPVARSIIEAHGGRIWVESKIGQGTTVFFSLLKAAPTPEED
ncbi:MAG TPA: ATP-binding protein [Anaerolineaceae bacterium]|nr:ATP-binding protein [Anaerolineaceae bacterium]